jgi:hypothetical protein
LANLPNFALDRLSRYEQPFGVRLAESFMHSKCSIGANSKSEGAFLLGGTHVWNKYKSHRLAHRLAAPNA